MAGDTTRRGYGTNHQRTRKQLAPLVASGKATCWRCGDPIKPGEAWHLGHDDKRRTRGPEHELCNLQAAAAKTNGTALHTSEDW